MARNRQFKAPKEEFPEDEELVTGNIGPRRGVAAVAKKGKKQSPPPEEDDQDFAEDSRRPAKGKKKPARHEEDEGEEEEPVSKPDKRKVAAEPPSKHGKGKQKPPPEDEEEDSPIGKNPSKSSKPFGKGKPPADSEDPDNPPSKKPLPKSKKGAANKPTTAEDIEGESAEEASKKNKKKGKKSNSVLPTEKSTPRADSKPRGRLDKKTRIMCFVYIGLNVLGIGAGVVAFNFDWVTDSVVTLTLTKMTIDIGGVSASQDIKDVYDACTTSCSAIQYYYATSIIMLAAGSLGLLCALAEGVLMALHVIRPSFHHHKILMRAAPAAPILWVLGVAAMVVSFNKLKDDSSDLTIGTGMAIAFAGVGVLAASAGLGFFASRKLGAGGEGEEEEQVQSTQH